MDTSRKKSDRSTIKDVAREANVSIATVSLALADHPNVAETTKKRVWEAVEKLNYLPSAMGRGLKSQRTNAVGLIVPHSGQHVFSHLYFMELMSGVSEVLNSVGMTMVLSTSLSETNEDDAYLKLLRSQQVDGVIIASAALNDKNIELLNDSNYPFVFIGRYPQNIDVPSVGVDDIGGAAAAVDHLIKQHHHQKIAHISGPLGHLSAIDRRIGYLRTLSQAGIEARPEYEFEGDYSEEAGFQGMLALLKQKDPPTALFAANDETALGALQALRAVGIEPGARFPITSFDDVLIARVASPPLTTIHQPMKQLGEQATKSLLTIINGEKLVYRQIELPVNLVIRNSCGCQEHSSGVI